MTQFDALGSAALVLDTGAPGLEPYTVLTSIHILKETVEARILIIFFRSFSEWIDHC